MRSGKASIWRFEVAVSFDLGKACIGIVYDIVALEGPVFSVVMIINASDASCGLVIIKEELVSRQCFLILGIMNAAFDGPELILMDNDKVVETKGRSTIVITNTGGSDNTAGSGSGQESAPTGPVTANTPIAGRPEYAGSSIETK